MKQTKIPISQRHLIQSELTSTQSNEEESAKATTKATASTRCRIVSFRITEEQYADLVIRCINSHGERLISVSDFARYTVMHQRSIQPSELPLERYRLAIAAQLATAVSDMIQELNSIKMLTFEAQIDHLKKACADMEKIQHQIQILLNNN